MRSSGFFSDVSRILLLLLLAGVLPSCLTVPLRASYQGPAERPVQLDQYYSVGSSYTDYLDEILLRTEDFAVRRIYIDTDFGNMKIDYFQRKESSDSLILVFPVKGGSNIFSNHFARYFAERGFDTAVVHRDGSFKDPENFENLEKIFRNNVIRDRIAMDFFEKEYSKRVFGSFGISRGAINAAMTAGIDERLKYNVLAMGGSDMAILFAKSNDGGMVKYRKRVMNARGISQEEFLSFLRTMIRTDPKAVSSHIDARNTLLFLAVFDNSVPFSRGLELRRDIGYPQTEFILAGHYTSVALTQVVRLLPPSKDFCLFPIDYVETESLTFFREKFGEPKSGIKHAAFTLLKSPFTLIARIISLFYQ